MAWRPAGSRRVAETLAPGATGADLTLSGDLVMGAAAHVEMGAGSKLKLDPAVDLSNCSLQWRGDADNGLSYVSANVWRLASGGAYTFQNQLGLPGWNGTLAGTKLGLVETTDAPSTANITYIYSRDAAGKTQTVARAGAASTEAILVTEI